MRLDLEKFDFIDFGASRGDSIEFAKACLGGNQGVGVDISPKKIAAMKERSYDCILGDITDLSAVPDKQFRFCILSHVLEHLPDQQAVDRAIAEAIRISKDFIFLRGPFFEADQWLADHGLKFFWSDWKGHSFHLTAQNFMEAVATNLSVEPEVYGYRSVYSSMDPVIHSINSPVDSLFYSSSEHPEKPFQVFDKKIYKEIVSLVPLNGFNDLNIDDIFPEEIELFNGLVDRSAVESYAGAFKQMARAKIKSTLNLIKQ